MKDEVYESPLGALTLAADVEGLCGAWFEGQKHFGKAGSAVLVDGEECPVSAAVEGPEARVHLDAARTWLDRYFTGENPGALPRLHLIGSPFQQAVWNELVAIPYGATTTYGAIVTKLASRLGRVTSARAVGGAVGRNPVSIIVPCHRVLGADRSITGYAGGLDRKRALLHIEGVSLA